MNVTNENMQAALTAVITAFALYNLFSGFSRFKRMGMSAVVPLAILIGSFVEGHMLKPALHVREVPASSSNDYIASDSNMRSATQVTLPEARVFVSS